ncbi:MAG: response regulator [Planctomycetia bacterium]|nr:response regulator [Planctomycetia bacterium]
MNARILLAERDSQLREYYRAYLDRHGFEVKTASDGLDCLTKIRNSSPDLLILDRDLLWGGSDGVLACLNEDGLDSQLPVILTASCYPCDLRSSPACLERLSHRKLLSKPFHPRHLIEAIHSVIGRFSQGRHRIKECV